MLTVPLGGCGPIPLAIADLHGFYRKLYYGFSAITLAGKVGRSRQLNTAVTRLFGATSERNRICVDATKAIYRLFGLVQSTQFDDFDLESLQVVCAPFQVGF